MNVNSRSWQPSAGIKASALFHVGALAAAASGLSWPWVLSGLAANHALLTATGLWPRSTLLGNNMRNLSDAARQAGQIAITIDDGPDPRVTPATLDILEAADAQATFFCIGQAVQRYPALAREIVRRGHAIENHSHAHRHHFSLMGPRRLREEIDRAQTAIGNATGTLPLFFRAPAGLRNPLLDPVLQKLDLRLVSWTRRGFDTVTPDPERVLRRLSYGLKAADILLLHDGHAASMENGEAVILKVLPDLLRQFQQRRLKPVLLRNAA